MMLITYRGSAVAMAGADRFYLAPHIDGRSDGDPLKAFVCFLVLYARDVQTGALPAESSRYLPRRAERYAREALIPAGEFAAVQHRSDRHLADHFNAPIEQVIHRREDLAGIAPTRALTPASELAAVLPAVHHGPERRANDALRGALSPCCSWTANPRVAGLRR